MNNMGFKILNNLHVIVVGEKDPTQRDWQEYLDALQEEVKRGVDVTEMRTLVFSDGGGPNASQRKAVSDLLLKGRTSPVAIVTGSAVMRGIMTALKWFNPEVRAYAPDEVRGALDFLRIPDTHFDTIKSAAKELQTSLRLQEVRALEQARMKLPN